MTRPSDPRLRVYTIGQTPRPDLVAELHRRFPGVRLDVVGALDGLRPEEITAGGDGPYPLETRLRDGSRVVVDAAWVEARIQQSLDTFAGEALAHLVLCAGPFPSLTVRPGPDGRTAPLLRPFHTAVQVLGERGWTNLALLVPFAAQAAPAAGKWRSAGFDTCRLGALTERPPTTSLPAWVASWASGVDADAVVFDYVGLPERLLSEVAAATGRPVVDLGALSLDRLADALSVPDSPPPSASPLERRPGAPR